MFRGLLANIVELKQFYVSFKSFHDSASASAVLNLFLLFHKLLASRSYKIVLIKKRVYFIIMFAFVY